LELEGGAAKQLGSLDREGGIDKVIGKKAQALSLWRRLLSGMRKGSPSVKMLCVIQASGQPWRGVSST